MNQALTKREEYQQLAMKIVHRQLTLDRVLKEVSHEFHLPMENLVSGAQTQAVVIPRAVAHLFAMKVPGYILRTVGQEIGGKNYSTVIHGLKTVVNYYDINPLFRIRVNRIRERLGFSQNSFDDHISRWRR